MENKVFSLSVDEIGMSLLLASKEEAAKRFLAAAIGKVDPSEVRGRLFAAHNTLMARRLAIWSEAESKVVLDNNLEALIRALAEPDRSIVANVVDASGRKNLIIHFADETVVEVRDRGPIGLDLLALNSPEDALASIQRLLPYAKSLSGKRHVVSMALDQLRSARTMSANGAGAAEGFLHEIGLDEESSNTLASDLAHGELRAILSKLDYRNGEARLDKVLLMLRSAERGWIFKPFGDESSLMVEGAVASREDLFKELKELLA